MTIKQLNKKIEKINQLVSELEEDQQEVLDTLQEKIDAIRARAYVRDSGENTENEMAKIGDLYLLKGEVGEIDIYIEEINTINIDKYNY